jgi:hypothetical protein
MIVNNLFVIIEIAVWRKITCLKVPKPGISEYLNIYPSAAFGFTDARREAYLISKKSFLQELSNDVWSNNLVCSKSM